MGRMSVLLLLLALPARAEIYRWTDEQGRPHFADRPPAPGSERVEVAPNVTGTGGLRPSESHWLERIRARETEERESGAAGAAITGRTSAGRRRCARYGLSLADLRAERRRGCRIGRCAAIDRRIEYYRRLLETDCR